MPIEELTEGSLKERLAKGILNSAIVLGDLRGFALSNTENDRPHTLSQSSSTSQDVELNNGQKARYVAPGEW